MFPVVLSCRPAEERKRKSYDQRSKRRSIIAPKSRDNYPYILNVRHLRYLIIIFWLFNSKLYGSTHFCSVHLYEKQRHLFFQVSFSIG